MHHDISLKQINSFGVEAKAGSFLEIDSVESFLENLKNIANPLILGGASNVLFTKNYDGCVIQNNIKGCDILENHEDHVVIKVGAGEVWHDFVQWSLAEGFYGLENLSLIPGSVGAAPIQNIGAYGVEVREFIESVEAYDFEGEIRCFAKESCQFGYRESVFKSEYRDRLLITHVIFKLSKTANLKLDYGKIKEELSIQKVLNPTPMDVAKAVIAIRQSKLPDPQKLGNAGSFFKNPVVKKSELERLQKDYPEIPFYRQEEKSLVKLPAGWLIEKSGWKGKRVGDAGVHSEQALVIVNHGDATGEELLNVAKEVKSDVLKLFKIDIVPEVRVL